MRYSQETNLKVTTFGAGRRSMSSNTADLFFKMLIVLGTVSMEKQAFQFPELKRYASGGTISSTQMHSFSVY